MRLSRALCCLLVVACGSDGNDGPTPPPRPDPLAPLPEPKDVTSRQFADSIRCAQCHVAIDDDPDALRDDAGRDVSPISLWRPSMMALAARDPFFLAAWNEERSRFPDNVAAIDATCSRCHAPMGAVESEDQLSFEDVVSGDTDAANLGRDGVSCALCHQIRPNNLGRADSYTGGYEIGFNRQIFGPHIAPDTGPMEFFLEFTPVQAEHILDSEVCATCHTVIVTPLDPQGNPRDLELTEQATYFEWLNSAYSEAGSQSAQTCADCHLPTVDADGVEIRAPISTNPDSLLGRTPFGRHLFVGGGAYMSRLFDANQAWAGLSFEDGELAAAADESETHLRTAAEVTVESASRAGGTATVVVKVVNQTGHKLPTGYPTRRLWLRFVAKNAAGDVVFESGSASSAGALAGDDPEAVRPHINRVTSSDEVVIWEAVLVDEDDKPTHRPLAAVAYAKDSRILPIGWVNLHPELDRMEPVGTESDGDFIAGSDSVTFEFPASEALTLEIDLLYQSLPPHVGAAHEEWPTPAGVRFAEMVEALPPAPISIAQVTGSID